MREGEDLLGLLLGRWSLERSLLDERLGAEGRFQGTACFDQVAPGMAAYREEGTLRFLDHVGAARRSLGCAAEGGQAVAFTFPDGRRFHRLELAATGYEAVHRCGDDRYDGRFVLLGDDEWTATWRVEGPRKRLLLVGSYRRLADGAAGSDGGRRGAVDGLFTGERGC
jgi:hypothetical protein